MIGNRDGGESGLAILKSAAVLVELLWEAEREAAQKDQRFHVERRQRHFKI